MAKKVFIAYCVLLLAGLGWYQYHHSLSSRALSFRTKPEFTDSGLKAAVGKVDDPRWLQVARSSAKVRETVHKGSLQMLSAPSLVKERLELAARMDEVKSTEAFDPALKGLDAALVGAYFYAVNSKPVPTSRAVPITASMRRVPSSSGSSYSGSSYHK